MRALIGIGLLAAAALCATVVGVRAQDAVPYAGPDYLGLFWRILEPTVIAFAGIAGPILVTWVTMRVIRLLGVTEEAKQKEIEARIRDALHGAAVNGLKAAIAGAAGRKLSVAALNDPEIIAEAMRYVERLNPQAAAAVKPDELREVVLSKVPEVAATVATAKAAGVKVGTAPAIVGNTVVDPKVSGITMVSDEEAKPPRGGRRRN